ncbi:sugar phosphate isomerase/epimerase family protein [Paenibacillus sp. Soil750]|uniref:sugar phosphate isomerase/epimerase family protein n=1 Tax=Paenibacillus sp. Soil750 TaxID=1736398 RepID=UPI0006F474D9|nr:sugar phosphate isomerase/epimerase family protein [Paenibacillus sp. Soil750]KRE57629.1 xylose isomerase [Paenibacillus sp. Soil750]
MIWNRLGVLTDEVSPDFEKALNWAAEQGLQHVEVRVVNGMNVSVLTDDQIVGIRKMVEERGLYVSAIASPLFKCALDPKRLVESGDTFGQKEQNVEEHFKKLDRVIEIAKLLGTTRIRIFSFWRELEPEQHRDEIVHHLKRAGDIAAREGVILLLENEPSCNGGFAEEVAALVSAIDSPAVRGLWDPGNEAYGAREAFPSGYQYMKNALAHVHLKDAYIRQDGTPRCVPLGSGDAAITAQIKALEADGYEGLYTIETHFVPEGGSQLTGTRMTLDALRALLEEV